VGVGLTVSVSAGQCIVPDGAGGAYLVYFDTTQTASLAASGTRQVWVTVNPTTGATAVGGGSTVPTNPYLVIGNATTTTTGVSAVSNSRVMADSPTAPSSKYLGIGGGTVTGVINARQGVHLGGLNRTARHYASVNRTLPQTIESGVFETVTFQNVIRNVSDYGTLPFNPTNPGRLYAAVDGDYIVSCMSLFNNTSTVGLRRARILKYNSAGVIQNARYGTWCNGTEPSSMTVDVLIDAIAGDYFEFQLQQTSGVALTISAATGNTAWVTWGTMRLLQAD
jgi:hypothetical protein